jgi:hypothetical protein
VEEEALIGDPYKNLLIQHSKRKLVRKFSFARLKLWSSKNLPFQLQTGIHGNFEPDIFPEGIHKISPAVAAFKDTCAKGKRNKHCKYFYEDCVLSNFHL